MKRIVTAVSLALAASPLFAQSFDRMPTDPVMPAAFYQDNPGWIVAQPRNEPVTLASAGNTRSDVEISTASVEPTTTRFPERHVELQAGYFDPA